MRAAFWACAAFIAALWPGRLAGPLDGAPLDRPLEATLIGVALVAAVWLAPQFLRRRSTQTLIVVLLIWKAITSAALTQDGWCLRFTTPDPVFVDDVRIPHSWDVRADWWVDPPKCSAIMARSYEAIEEFPVWFYNLPPNNFRQPARDTERPPHVTLHFTLDGTLAPGAPGRFSVAASENVALRATIDGVAVDAAQLTQGVDVSAGPHTVAIAGELVRSGWMLRPQWNGEALWGSTTATLAPPTLADRLLRPLGAAVPPLVILALLGLAMREIASRVSRTAIVWTCLLSAAFAAVGFAPNAVVRIAPYFLLAILGLKLTARDRTSRGAALMIGVPFLALFVALHAGEAGIFTWYSIGDDWWMFQRFAYRIYLQGFWLEGGERAFWFQPLYRWIAGGLHMLFGDSSVGEFFWDAAAVVTGAMFAFNVTRTFSSFRWAVAAACITLATFTSGPAWYLFGRGLSEITSMGLLYAAAICAMRGRHGRWPYIVAAGALALLGFLARLNNLPIALAITVFALPDLPASALVRPTQWWPRMSRPLLAGLLVSMAIGLWLFTARTYYYTGVPSMLWGTQAGLLSIWQTTASGSTPIQNLAGSVLMVVMMSDPPRPDARALPIVIGVIASILGLLGVRKFRELPLHLTVMCMAGIAGAFVARGSAYPGRFSIHLVPVAVALTVCTVAVFFRPAAAPLAPPPAPHRP